MINQYALSQTSLVLESDLAGEFPLYLYWPEDQSILLYSKSITELLSDARVPKPLEISAEGLSFLLQSGVVPPPKTAYHNIYILSIGDKAKVATCNGKIDIQFSHNFPFLNCNRFSADEVYPDENLILQMLAEATISRIDESKPSFLFHSAGKDSNSIALALAEAGWQDHVTLITHRSKGKADESEISAQIAKKLGFKHQILYEVDLLQTEHKQAIENHFINSPFPCTDNVALAYPLYAHQLPELKGANIIDGMGNDVFIGHIPSRSEFKHQNLSKYLKYSRVISKHFASESLLQVAGRTRSEWTGLLGLSLADTKKIFPGAIDISGFWLSKDTNQEYLDFRAKIRGAIIDQEIFTRKVRNFADAVNGNIILPWANEEIAQYFAVMPEQYLYDRDSLKNKLILRKILKERMGLDSDALGKLEFNYDSRSIVLQNWGWIFGEMEVCELWNQLGLVEVVTRLKQTMQSNHKYSGFSGRLIYRIYLLSAWYNRNQSSNRY